MYDLAEHARRGTKSRPDLWGCFSFHFALPRRVTCTDILRYNTLTSVSNPGPLKPDVRDDEKKDGIEDTVLVKSSPFEPGRYSSLVLTGAVAFARCGKSLLG